ncbi:hypothetical protein [Marinobacter subterrani]|uniref:hypothetical protein n=1 Tax=Marinobacter subterrani TaxID=1658765 RepID=UPI00235275EB|nr:hypothetical protein [Marinobacter subterrani]
MTTFSRARDRIRFDAVICCCAHTETLHSAAQAIAKDLAQLYGGVSIQPVTGSWAVNGNAEQAKYNTIAVEPGFKVSLSVLESESEPAYTHLQQVLADAIRAFRLPAQFVHVERTATEALHFDASTLNYCGTI